jgi:hypothetical protein
MLRRKQHNSVPITLQGNTPEAVMASKLTELCAGDTELCQALARLMILDPKKINIPLETFLTEGQEFETQGNKLRAEVAYRVAGALSLFQGDTEGVRKYFGKALTIAGNSRGEYKTLMDHLDDAVAIAKRYYGSV